MLVSKRTIIAFSSSIVVLSILSSLALFCYQQLYVELIYRTSYLSNFLLSLFCISISAFLYLRIVDIFFREKPLKLYKSGILCIFIEFSLVFLMTSWIGIYFKGLLIHLFGISSFCFFIPYTYNKMGKLLSKS